MRRLYGRANSREQTPNTIHKPVVMKSFNVYTKIPVDGGGLPKFYEPFGKITESDIPRFSELIRDR